MPKCLFLQRNKEESCIENKKQRNQSADPENEIKKQSYIKKKMIITKIFIVFVIIYIFIFKIRIEMFVFSFTHLACDTHNFF